MKRRSKIAISIIVTLLMFAMSTQTIAFADEKLTVNGTEVSKGDIVTYEYYAGGVDDAIAAAGCYIEFDPEFLEYIDDSIGFDVFNNALFNCNKAKEGYIYYSAVNAISGYDLSDSRLVVSLSFKVLDTAKGSTEITNTFDEFFTIEDFSTDLTSEEYTDSEKIEVNTFDGNNTSPYLGTDAEEMDKYLASTDYSIDEMLEGNRNTEADVGSQSGTISSKPVESDAAAAVSSGAENGGNSSDKPLSEEISSSQNSFSDENSEKTSNASVNGESKGGSGLIIAVVVIVFVAAVIGAATYLIISKKRQIK